MGTMTTVSRFYTIKFKSKTSARSDVPHLFKIIHKTRPTRFWALDFGLNFDIFLLINHFAKGINLQEMFST